MTDREKKRTAADHKMMRKMSNGSSEKSGAIQTREFLLFKGSLRAVNNFFLFSPLDNFIFDCPRGLTTPLPRENVGV